MALNNIDIANFNCFQITFKLIIFDVYSSLILDKR